MFAHNIHFQLSIRQQKQKNSTVRIRTWSTRYHLILPVKKADTLKADNGGYRHGLLHVSPAPLGGDFNKRVSTDSHQPSALCGVHLPTTPLHSVLI